MKLAELLPLKVYPFPLNGDKSDLLRNFFIYPQLFEILSLKYSRAIQVHIQILPTRMKIKLFIQLHNSCSRNKCFSQPYLIY